MQEAKKNKFSVKNILMNIVIFVTLVILILTIVFAIIKINDPEEMTFFGYKPLIVKTGSMEPNIVPGGLIIVKNTKFEDINVDDIITFRESDGYLNTHRVVEKTGNELWTKGDNNDSKDLMPVTSYNYKYKVVSIHNWVSNLNTGKGIFMYIVLPILGLIVLIIIIIVFIVSKRKSKGKRKKENGYLESELVNTESMYKEDEIISNNSVQNTNKKTYMDDLGYYENNNFNPNNKKSTDSKQNNNPSSLKDIDMDFVNEVLYELNSSSNINSSKNPNNNVKNLTFTNNMSNDDINALLADLEDHYEVNLMDRNENNSNQNRTDNEKTKKLIKILLALKAQNDTLKANISETERENKEFSNKKFNEESITKEDLFSSKNAEIEKEVYDLQRKISNIKFDMQDILMTNRKPDVDVSKLEKLENDNEVLVQGAKQQQTYIEVIRTELVRALSEAEKLKSKLHDGRSIYKENQELKKLTIDLLNDLRSNKKEITKLKEKLKKSNEFTYNFDSFPDSSLSENESFSNEKDTFKELLSQQNESKKTKTDNLDSFSSKSVDDLMEIYRNIDEN